MTDETLGPWIRRFLLEHVVGHVVVHRLGKRVVVARLEIVGELVVTDRQRAVLVGRRAVGLARFLAHGLFLRGGRPRQHTHKGGKWSPQTSGRPRAAGGRAA